MLTKHAAHRKDTADKPATFTHQHFRKVAEIIRAMHGDTMLAPNVTEIAEHFAYGLSHTNPNFDRHRFLMACQAKDSTHA